MFNNKKDVCERTYSSLNMSCEGWSCSEISTNRTSCLYVEMTLRSLTDLPSDWSLLNDILA